MTKQSVVLTELREEDLPFLFELWHTAEIMRYADEFPKLRGWSKLEDPQTAWLEYQAEQAAQGNGYVQFILSLTDGTMIGESFFIPLPAGYTFGKWQKPENILCLKVMELSRQRHERRCRDGEEAG